MSKERSGSKGHKEKAPKAEDVEMKIDTSDRKIKFDKNRARVKPHVIENVGI